MEVGEPGFELARVLEASGFICYDQIKTRGIGVVFVACGSNKFLKLYIWQKVFIGSSVGLQLKPSNRGKLLYFVECESMSLLIYSKYPLIMVLSGL